MHTVGKYSRDKQHKVRILADNLDKQDAGDKVDKVDTPAFEVGTPAADRVSKQGETAAPRSGEQAAHPSHVRGARTAHRRHFVPSPGHYLPLQFDRCQRVAFRECWIVRGVVEYPPGLFPTSIRHYGMNAGNYQSFRIQVRYLEISMLNTSSRTGSDRLLVTLSAAKGLVWG